MENFTSALECESRIGGCRNTAEEKKQFLVSVSADLLNDVLPFVASLEHDALEGRTISRLGNLYQKPLIGKISLDGFYRESFHRIYRCLY